MKDFSKQASAGAQFLDRINPNWYNQVSLEDLNMQHADTCVLGQMYGRYRDGIRDLLIDQDSDEDVKRGFRIGNFFLWQFRPKEEKLRWDLLGNAWKKEIESRRSLDFEFAKVFGPLQSLPTKDGAEYAKR